MANLVSDAELRRAYGEIISGWSSFKLRKRTAYIRHMSPLEQGVLDGEYLKFYEKAISKGLKSEEERVQSLHDSKLWTKEQEEKLANQEQYVKGLESTKAQLAIPSQIKTVNEQLEAGRLELFTLRSTKYSLVGMTAESYANKKLNELYIFNSLFADVDFKETFFTSEDFNDLEEHEVGEVILAYNTGIAHITEQVIRKISISPFFTRYFYLAKDDIYAFYGKPIARLTYFQSELARWGISFKIILSSPNPPPEEFLTDPDKLLEWHQTSTNTEKLINSAQPQANSGSAAATGIFGANSEDIKKMTGKEEFSIFDYAHEKGSEGASGKKKLSMKELMAMGQ